MRPPRARTARLFSRGAERSVLYMFARGGKRLF